MKKILSLSIFAILCFVGGFYAASLFSKKSANPMNMPAVYVPTGTPQKAQLNESTRYIALVKPLNSVDVRPQVVGEIKEVLFEDGQEVNEGDVLFRIDPDKYQANLAVAKATLAKAEADLKQIQNDYKRQEELHKDKFVSTADLEKSESKRLQAEAAVEHAKANLALAEIDMEHTDVTSPIKGRIGEALKTKGNYVSIGEPLARLVQTTPVKINFSLTDKEYLDLQRVVQNKDDFNGQNLHIELADKTLLPVSAEKIFIDNEMDRQTATVSMYAEFNNESGLLLPNNYVTLLLNNPDTKEAVTIPQSALYNDINGSYIMKVNQDNTVYQQYVSTGDITNGRIFVLSGLAPEEVIVLSGGQKLRNGQAIQAISTEAK